jgi:hypothetical protein
MDFGYVAVILTGASIGVERGISQQDVVFANLNHLSEEKD